MRDRRIRLTVNGRERSGHASPRLSLADFLRDRLGLRGTHVACEEGTCGACTVLLDDEAVCSCLVLAVQAHGRDVTTVEGLARDGRPTAIQQAFCREHALQCGFCTPGFLMASTALLQRCPQPSEPVIRATLGGNLCRCTGYTPVVNALLDGRASARPARPSRGLIGADIDPAEDEALVRGEGTFVSDVNFPGMVHAALLRSPHARARIIRLDVSAARSAPGVISAVSFRDLADAMKPLPQILPHPALRSRTPLPLASDRVRYVGEPIAIVIAKDRYQAEDAVALIDVSFEPEQPATDPEQALGEAAPRVHEDLPDNVAGRFGQEVGDVDAALGRSHLVVRERLTIGRLSGQPLEGRCITARYDDGRLTVWMSTQSPHTTRRVLADQVGLPEERVRVIAPAMGGGFGLKNRYYPEYTLVALEAIRTGRPVSWLEDRSESFTSTYHEREQVHDFALGVAADGTILAVRDRFVHDQGAYTPLGLVVPYVTSVSVPGPYRVPNYEVLCTIVFTNRTPTAPYRGAGKPQSCFVMERMLDKAARLLGLDGVEIRRRNLLRPDDFPYDTGLTDLDGTRVRYDSGDYPACLDKALRLIGHAGFPEEQRLARDGGRNMGLGVACFIEMGGRGPFEGARVQLEPTGRVSLHSGICSLGQKHKTTLAQVCAESLGVPLTDIDVSLGDTEGIPRSIGTYAGRVAVMAGNAVAEAGGRVRAKVLAAAARVLDVPAETLEVSDGRVCVATDPRRSLTLAQVARHVVSRAAESAREEDPEGLQATAYFECSQPTYSNGAYAVVVEVDVETGLVTPLRHALVHDCGVMINPRVVEDQLAGGVVQGLGAALLEEFRYDELGHPQTTSLRHYLTPTIGDSPPLLVDHVITPSPFNPLGVKGVGEAGPIPVAAAVNAAIEDALEGRVRLSRTPVHPWALQAVIPPDASPAAVDAKPRRAAPRRPRIGKPG